MEIAILNPRFSILVVIGRTSMLSLIVVLCLHMLVVSVYEAAAAEATLEQLVAGAKKEGEVTLIASASTFGGKKGFAELEAAFNKRYGLTSKVNLAPGPSFPQVAARVMSEPVSWREVVDGSVSRFGRNDERHAPGKSVAESTGRVSSLRPKKWKSFRRRRCSSTHRFMASSITRMRFQRTRHRRAMKT